MKLHMYSQRLLIKNYGYIHQKLQVYTLAKDHLIYSIMIYCRDIETSLSQFDISNDDFGLFYFAPFE